jgi:hypothetical protein
LLLTRLCKKRKDRSKEKKVLTFEHEGKWKDEAVFIDNMGRGL